MTVKLNKAITGAMVLLVATLFLKENINSMAIILVSILILILIIKKAGYKSFSDKEMLWYGLPLVLYFVLAITGLLLNQNSNGTYVLRLVPFLIAPLLLYAFQKFPESRDVVIRYFIAATVVFLLFLDLLAIRDMLLSHSLYVVHEGRTYYRFMYTRFTGEYFNHIYLSTYILMAIFLVLQFKSFRRKYIRLGILCFFACHLLLLSSRAVIIAVLLGGFLVLTYISIRDRRKVKNLILLIAGLAAAVLLVYAFRNTLLLNRYSQAFELYEHQDRILQRNYSINNRIKVYIIGASLLSEPRLYGINGTGLSYDIIRDKYNTTFREEFPFETSTFNTHNQFINNFIDWGIPGLVFTAFLLYRPVATAYKRKQYWLLTFWLSFVFILAMESFLIRHRGIVFFLLFYALLVAVPKVGEDRLPVSA